ncbi:anti-sigma factor antagonist [Modestobacter sp. I12A-02628]|uniref:Anti-sigma factor antagonist n=1 Tax=Goekera deserti TaxID=2497753 RepID=A0A7K3WFK3_9ACTN|nr:STAS domain-containing protein [Goekera deserti]MPR00056.1 anti-sigma factor antagonist [Goekera deserti]NDI49835.1 anti-sigma factor antagonist [Goekera deserti]NEL55197.1 STAS domain-containing protein [Goekera deserti]
MGARSGGTPDAAAASRRPVIATTSTDPHDLPFSVELRHPDDGDVVAAVAGELDAATNPALQQALLRALREAREVLTVDLEGVTFFGSAGVTALVWLSQHPEAHGKHVRVIATSRVVTGPLELTGLLARLDVQGMPPAGPSTT